MKKSLAWLPWLVMAACVLWVAGSLRPKPETGFRLHEFGRLPVLLEGRLQPLDSVGRNSLLQTRGKQTVLLTNGQSMPASEWIALTLMKPEAADALRIFRIDHPDLLSLLKLPSDEKFFSYNDLTNNLPDLDRQAQRVNGIDDKLRSPFEKGVWRLFQALTLYHRLKNSLVPEGVTNYVAELAAYKRAIPAGVEALRNREAGKEYNQAAFNALVKSLSLFDVLRQQSFPLLVPPHDAQHSRDGWENIGSSLMGAARTGELNPAVDFLATMSDAFRSGDVAGFNKALVEYRQWLEQHGLTKELKKGRAEAFFSFFAPFYKAMSLYVLAFILACAFWVKLSAPLRRSAVWVLVLALLIHTTGLIFRMALEGRPPVTNLYSSAIFIGWGAVGLGLFLEKFFRDGIGIVAAAAIGFITLIIAHHLSLSGDTMIMLRAVLDTNFWLATHVVTITIGYSATFMAGFLAVLFIARGLFTRTLDLAAEKGLGLMVYGIICFATLFSFIGTILGGIWADQSWGRFWGWDPKENGALLIVLWNAIYLHARWGRLLSERGLMCLAVFGNIVTSFSWFGVNMLGIGLHSYGFMDAAFKWLMAFVVSQVVVIALGLLPEKYWLSWRGRTAQSSPSADSSKPAPAGA